MMNDECRMMKKETQEISGLERMVFHHSSFMIHHFEPKVISSGIAS
jgi:hypothetical protein